MSQLSTPRKHLNLTDDEPVTPPLVTTKMVFCFGSNTGGIHGLGAAQYAHKYEGAVLGVGVGHRGNSYAIPTKDVRMHRGRLSVGHTLPVVRVGLYVNDFIKYATAHPELEFKVTQIGCGHAGLDAKDVAPLFVGAPDNCYFDTAWAQFLPGKRFWGTF